MIYFLISLSPFPSRIVKIVNNCYFRLIDISAISKYIVKKYVPNIYY